MALLYQAPVICNKTRYATNFLLCVDLEITTNFIYDAKMLVVHWHDSVHLHARYAQN